MTRNNRVLEVISALFYLPENYRLTFAGDAPVDQSFFKEVVTLVERDKLGDRIDFSGKVAHLHQVIVSKRKSRAKNKVSGDTPEALASAILEAARTR